MFTPDFEMSFLVAIIHISKKEKIERIKGLLESAHSCYGLSLSIVLLNSVLHRSVFHRSSSLSLLFSRVDSVFWPY